MAKNSFLSATPSLFVSVYFQTSSASVSIVNTLLAPNGVHEAREHQLVDEDGVLLVDAVVVDVLVQRDASDRIALAGRVRVLHVAAVFEHEHAAVAVEGDGRRLLDHRVGEDGLQTVTRLQDELFGLFGRRQREHRIAFREVRVGVGGIGFVRPAAPAPAAPAAGIRRLPFGGRCAGLWRVAVGAACGAVVVCATMLKEVAYSAAAPDSAIQTERDPVRGIGSLPQPVASGFSRTMFRWRPASRDLYGPAEAGRHRNLDQNENRICACTVRGFWYTLATPKPALVGNDRDATRLPFAS